MPASHRTIQAKHSNQGAAIVTPQEEQEFRKQLQTIIERFDNEDGEPLAAEAMALFKAQAAQVDVAARIDELSRLDNQFAYKVCKEDWKLVCNYGSERLEQLHNQKKEAV
jgi:hypothetical protein